jgi:hypothetical protein
MAAPSLGQMVFVARPQTASAGWDPGFVLTNTGAGQHGSTSYMVTALVFRTEVDYGHVTPITCPCEVWPTRAAAVLPAFLDMPQAASVL